MELTFLQRLGVGAEADERAVRRAYARELKLIDQEHDLDGFQALREAYDLALLRLRRPELFETAEHPDAGTPAAVSVDESDRVPPAGRDAVPRAATDTADGQPPTQPPSPADTAPGHDTPATTPSVDDPELLAQAVFGELRAKLAALAPAQSPYAALDSELPWSQALRESLDDPRLDNIHARRYFEGCVAMLLAEGWRPGHEALFVAAVDVFGWDADRRRVQAYGQVGGMIDNAIDERAVFDAQDADVLADQRTLLPRLRDEAPPTERELALHTPTLELMIARFPNWLAMVASVDNIMGWRQRNGALPGWRRKLALLGQKRPAAHQYYRPASSASWFNARWAWGLIVVVVVLLRAIFPGQDKHTGRIRTEADFVKQSEQQLDRQDYAGAIDSANRAIALASDRAPAYALRAAAYNRLDKKVAAINDIDHARALAPTSAYVSRIRAWIMLEQARNAEALAAADDACRQAPGDPASRNVRAEIHHAMGHAALALADLEASLELYQDQYHVLVNRGLLLGEAGRRAEAITQLEAAITAHPDQPRAYLVLADLYRQNKTAEQAMAVLDRGVAAAPDAELYLLRAQLRAPGDREGRERDFTSALALTAQPLRVLLERARWEAGTANYSAALATLSTATDRAQGTSELAKVQAARGALYAKMGKFTEALQQYDAALKIDPDLAAAREGRSIAARRLGRQPAG